MLLKTKSTSRFILPAFFRENVSRSSLEKAAGFLLKFWYNFEFYALIYYVHRFGTDKWNIICLFIFCTYLHLHEIHLGTYKKNQFTKLVRYVGDSFVKNYMSRHLIDQLFVQIKSPSGYIYRLLIFTVNVAIIMRKKIIYFHKEQI